VIINEVTNLFKFWDAVNLEDIQICENVQVGTSSTPYTGGRFSFRFEETIHRFQNMVVDKVLAEEGTRYRIPEGDSDYDVP
jgi:choline monooxygenase